MPERLSELLEKAAEALHWLGKYDVSNALVLLKRLVVVEGLRVLGDLEQFVVEAEKSHKENMWHRPQDEFVTVFSDETSEHRDAATVDRFLSELRDVAGAYGFDISMWGSGDSVRKAMKLRNDG